MAISIKHRCSNHHCYAHWFRRIATDNVSDKLVLFLSWVMWFNNNEIIITMINLKKTYINYNTNKTNNETCMTMNNDSNQTNVRFWTPLLLPLHTCSDGSKTVSWGFPSLPPISRISNQVQLTVHKFLTRKFKLGNLERDATELRWVAISTHALCVYE